MRRPPLTDVLLALGLVVLAQVTVWTGDVGGPRALVALIALAMVKLAVRDRVQAVVAAYEAGVVVPGER